MAEELARFLRGWLGYFGKCQTPSVLLSLEEWTRRRLRSAIWKQWKRSTVRFAELRKRGVGKDLAAQTAGSAHGPCRLANNPALAIALPNAYCDSLRIPRLTVGCSLNSPNRRMRTRTYGVATGKAGDGLPMSILAQGLRDAAVLEARLDSGGESRRARQEQVGVPTACSVDAPRKALPISSRRSICGRDAPR